MLRRIFLPTAALFLLAPALLAGEANALTEVEKSAGWRLLFDGKTFGGWQPIGKAGAAITGWVVQDGVLWHAKAAGGGDLVTAESFGDFELVWEWRIGFAANSGVKYEMPDATKGVGFEYQLLDDENEPDGKRGGRLHQTGGLYDLIEPPADKKISLVGEWNASRIVIKGAHVEQWLNGVKTVEFEMGGDDLKARIAKSKYAKIAGFGEKVKSPILLQDHGGEVAFRSIKLRALDAK